MLTETRLSAANHYQKCPGGDFGAFPCQNRIVIVMALVRSFTPPGWEH